MGDRDTRATDWIDAIPAGTTNNTALTASASKAALAAAPESNAVAGSFVFDLRAPAAAMPGGNINRAVHYDLAFAAQDAANKTGSFRVWGWRPVGSTWIPRLLLEGTFVAGTLVGLSGETLDETWFLADAITVSADNTRGASAQVDTAADENGCAVLSFDADGSAVLEVECSRDGHTVAAIRALLAGK